jgi:amphi-Trp domain-containing protein
MSEVEIERKEQLSRAEVAQLFSRLAAALADGEKVEVALGASTVKLHVPNHVRCEIEVEIDDDEVELEVELKWRMRDEQKPVSAPAARRARTPARRRTS